MSIYAKTHPIVFSSPVPVSMGQRGLQHPAAPAPPGPGFVPGEMGGARKGQGCELVPTEREERPSSFALMLKTKIAHMPFEYLRKQNISAGMQIIGEQGRLVS